MKHACVAVLVLGTSGFFAQQACAQNAVAPLRLVDSSDLKTDLHSGLDLTDFQARQVGLDLTREKPKSKSLTITDLLVADSGAGLTQVTHQEHLLYAPNGKQFTRLTLSVTEETDWYTAARDVASSRSARDEHMTSRSVQGLGQGLAAKIAPRLTETRLVEQGAAYPAAEMRKERETNFNLTYTRGWPGAVSISGGGVALDVTPHAGFGIGSKGSSAEAGAVVSLSQTVKNNLSALGIRDGRSYGDQGRWYVFAAASGRAVGYNFTGSLNKLQRSGVSTDTGSYIGDAQAGMGWRKGALQASFGYVQRKVKSHGIKEEDNFVALTLSVKPNW
ncbi:MAG: lipid A-modifier LpxR family protein [Asticcacaulis sp.]